MILLISWLTLDFFFHEKGDNNKRVKCFHSIFSIFVMMCAQEFNECCWSSHCVWLLIFEILKGGKTCLFWKSRISCYCGCSVFGKNTKENNLSHYNSKQQHTSSLDPFAAYMDVTEEQQLPKKEGRDFTAFWSEWE